MTQSASFKTESTNVCYFAIHHSSSCGS